MALIKCPECGSEMEIVFSSCDKQFREITTALDKFFDVPWKTDHYSGTKDCQCGKVVEAVLHVTVVPKENKNDRHS
ncbi:MAG: hypothetical protein LBS57_07490 [Treponema sp.]|jgi:uncharacterized protein (UPF0212 family)|nr:hypothetical protein [Treponema sp.]